MGRFEMLLTTDVDREEEEYTAVHRFILSEDGWVEVSYPACKEDKYYGGEESCDDSNLSGEEEYEDVSYED
jgi:hypothetical protein